MPKETINSIIDADMHAGDEEELKRKLEAAKKITEESMKTASRSTLNFLRERLKTLNKAIEQGKGAYKEYLDINTTPVPENKMPNLNLKIYGTTDSAGFIS